MRLQSTKNVIKYSNVVFLILKKFLLYKQNNFFVC